jgi:hypothetical protein
MMLPNFSRYSSTEMVATKEYRGLVVEHEAGLKVA